MKQNPIKTARNKADQLYQRICLKLHPKSTVSGKPAQVAHHFIPKSLSNALRYDVKNGLTMTNGEHSQHHIQGDPEICEKATANKPQHWQYYIKRKRREIVKPTLGWYRENIKRLEELLKIGEWSGS